MFSFTCPRCSLKSFSVEGSHCFRCDKKATTNHGLNDSRQQEMATSRDPEAATGSRNIQFQNRKQANKLTVQIRKRSESNDIIISEDIQAHKQYREESSRTNDDVVSHYCKTESNNLDYMQGMCVETCHKASDNINLDETQLEFLKGKKPQSYNQVKQGLCSLDKTVHLTVNKNAESNIGILQCFPKQNTPGKISNYEESSAKHLQSMDDILAVKGPSDLSVKDHGPKLPGENLLSCSSSNVQSVQPGITTKFPCNVCHREIREHAERRGRRNFYLCCVCKYKTNIAAYLQMHSDIHCPQKVCNVCSKEYREGNLHDSEHTCKECGKRFDCKTLLDHHSANNEAYFLEHCWVCFQNIHDHFTRNMDGKIYVCCACNFRTKYIKDFKVHSNMHSPKLFCMICKEEYSMKEKNFHGREWNCNVCGKELSCKTLLEDHSVIHKDYFSSYCRICKEKIDKHYIKFENRYKCCLCAKIWIYSDELQTHLHSHNGLRLFKCDWCKRRFFRDGDRSTHSKTCLPYKCKICCARFPCSVTHDKHRLEKHGLSIEDAIV